MANIRRWSTSLALSIVMLASAPGVAAADTISFVGTVQHGQRYEHKLSGLYTFVLSPQADGWEIDVFTPTSPKRSLTAYTPPLHFGQQELINSKNFLVPGQMIRGDRYVIFSTKVLAIHYPPNSADIAEIAKDGTIVFRIKDLCLGNPTDPEPRPRSYIEQMTFEVTVTFNPKPSKSPSV